MKKKYKKPVTEIVFVNTSSLLAGSGLGGNPKTPGMTRYRNSLWDDEEDNLLYGDEDL